MTSIDEVLQYLVSNKKREPLSFVFFSIYFIIMSITVCFIINLFFIPTVICFRFLGWVVVVMSLCVRGGLCNKCEIFIISLFAENLKFFGAFIVLFYLSTLLVC